MDMVTCKAPVNIAAIKYWGKRDEELILPLNDSISVTLSTDVMCAKTTVATSPNFKDDKFWLNGSEESVSNPRLVNCLTEIRRIARNSGDEKIKSMLDWKVHIVSENNFPTAAGLASSAAGYACLVFALARLFGIEGDISHIARRGSGSACRSIHGGFVTWKMGEEKDGSDSIAKQIAPASHWKELKMLILVVNSSKKAVGSSVAMQRSVRTSDYLNNQTLETRVRELTDAILNKNFEMFGTVTMKDSNRLHSVCLDTYPPVQYLNDTSHYIIHMMHSINDFFGKVKVAYSFDAGPNACLFLLQQDVSLVLSIINHFLPPGGGNANTNGEPYFRGEKVEVPTPPSELIKAVSLTPRPVGALKGIIYVGVGDGPEVLGPSESLINNDGLPKNLKCV